MALYGLWAGTLAAAMFSVAMAVFVLWANRQFERQDREWLCQQLYVARPTEQVLEDSCSECSGSYRHW